MSKLVSFFSVLSGGDFANGFNVGDAEVDGARRGEAKVIIGFPVSIPGALVKR